MSITGQFLREKINLITNLSSSNSIFISPLYLYTVSFIFFKPIPCINLSFLFVIKLLFFILISFILLFSIFIKQKLFIYVTFTDIYLSLLSSKILSQASIALSKALEKIKRIYHDINNHMICISNLSNEKDVKEYVKSLDLNIGYINFNFGNKILDIIISEKYQLCKDKGIRFDIVADFSKLDFIDMMDLCVIFSLIII